MFLGDWLRRRARLTPDKIALLDAEAGMVPVTYRAWDEAAGRTANLLRGLGVGKGDRVAILALNCVAYLDVWFACAKLGAIMQPLNYRLTPAELAALLDDATPSVLIYGAEFAETARSLHVVASSVQRWVAIEPPNHADRADHSLSERNACDSAVEPVELYWDDPWVICYTGGTTGTPKGAVLTHGNIGANAVNTVMSWGLTPDDVAVLNAPLFHTGGLNVFTAPLVQIGGCSIVCKGFEVNQVFDLIEHAGVTVYFGVPTTYIAMQQHQRWEAADFSRLKLVLSGGAPCPLPVFEAFWRRGIAFKTGYGLTEAGPNTFCLPDADVRRKPGAVGFPMFYVDVRVADDAGRELGPGEIGQLLIRGPHVCAGYWGRPAETARAIIGGWLHTGDLAVRDAEGYYTIVGRLKDVIISGGENIYPAEVESVLSAHPAVAEVALIAAPDARWGEVGWAVAVARPGQQINPTDILAFAGERLARYKLPRQVIITNNLPKTAAGKVDKQALVRTYVTPQRKDSTVSNIPTLPDINSQMINTPRLQIHVLSSGPTDGVPVLFIHGNASSATYWEETMLALPEGFRAIAPDLRGYGDTEDKLVDATRGAGDWVDDVLSLADTLGLGYFHVVGHSLGGALVFSLLPAAGERILSITLAAPGSPYGFGGTKDVDGTPTWPDCAGSGGGTVNAEFPKRMAEGDRGEEGGMASPRVVMNSFYWKPPFRPAREEELLSSLMSEKVGGDRYPGDLTTSENWPGVAPGIWGPINALAPSYVGDTVERFVGSAHRPPVLWVRGANDQIVSDTSLFELGFLGKLGAVPGWPGDEIYPPQPMVGQIRRVLERYAAAGGSFTELVLDECGHTPYIEKPEAFNAALHSQLKGE